MTLPTSACHGTVLKELRDFPATDQAIRPDSGWSAPELKGLTPVKWLLYEAQAIRRNRPGAGE